MGGPVYHILRQVNGRIIIGGAFTSVNGVPLNRVARVQPDGSLDSVFDPGTGANDMVLSMALQTDGSVVAGGLFATYNGTSVGMFARIYGDSILPAITAQFTVPNTFLLSWPSWASNYALQVTENLQAPNWSVVTNAPALQLNQLILTLPTTAGSKFYRLISQ